MKEKFRDIKVSGNINISLKEKGYWSESKENILWQIQEVCEDYLDMGYNLTLRQMYYQLVSKDAIPNHDKVYKKLGKLKDELLYAGITDWRVFVDRGRVPHIGYFEDDIPSALQRTINCYSIDKQLGQPYHIEVWTEKDAISGILRRAIDPYTVRLVVNKGYTSSTAIYDSYRRFVRKIEAGQKVRILYFGDHDPSGLDMIRDIRNRIMTMFLNGDALGTLSQIVLDWANLENIRKSLGDMDSDLLQSYIKIDEDGDSSFDWYRYFFEEHFQVKHIGLTMEQIKKYNPPPNPAKLTDPRAKAYVKQYGPVSWEVDALRPEVMTDIVTTEILSYMDDDIYQKLLVREEEEIEKFKRIVDDIDYDAY